MKICIRDDDTNFFTDPREIEEAYKELWGNIIVTLAVVPFIHKSFFIPLELKNLEKRVAEDHVLLKKIFDTDSKMSKEEFEDYNQYGFIGKNNELICYIKEKIESKKAFIVQHGVRHKYYLSGPEMVKSYTKAESILEGRKYLEKVFDSKVDIIVPPNNEVDLDMIKELDYCSMNLLTSGGIRYKNIVEKLFVYYKKSMYKDYFYKKIFLNQRNYKFKLGNVKIFSCETFGVCMDVNDFFEKIKVMSSYNNSLCIATHYHELNQYKDYKKRFTYLIKKIQQEIKNVEFVGADRLFDS